MKKIFITLAFLIIISGTTPIVFAQTQTLTPESSTQAGLVGDCTEGDGEYCLLEPIQIGTTGESFKKVEAGMKIGDYLEKMFKIILGVIGVMTVIMIIVGGVQYMTTDAIGGKEHGKETVTNAIVGLILALSSWLILKTINPQLVTFDLTAPPVAVQGSFVDLPATVLSDYASQEQTALGQNNGTDRAVGASGGYEISGSAYNSPSVSNPACASIPAGYELKHIVVKAVATHSTENLASFLFQNSSGQIYSNCIVKINVGANGVAQPGTAVVGDRKTPIGESTITADRRLSSSLEQAVMTQDGTFNMGAAFVNTGIVDAGGNNRYIGFHGMKKNKLGSTAGCIRMYNDDLLVLFPHMKQGVKVIIVNSYAEYNQRADKIYTY